MDPFWSQEYWTRKGDIDLYIYRKRETAPASGPPLPVLFLVHGSSFSARTSFDLRFQDTDQYSMMDVFVRAGFDVWTMDHEGYGRSGRGAGNSDIASGVADLAAAAEVVERETGQGAAAYYGQSSGALRAAAFAGRHPGRVNRAILDAFVWTGEGSPTLAKRRERLDEWRSSNVRQVDRAFFHSIFTRDLPGLQDLAVADVIAEQELPFGGTVPTGTYLDMCANLPVVQPADVLCPVQIIRGEHDGIATEEDVTAFFLGLPNKEKQIVILPGQTHVGPFGVNRHRFFHVMLSFLTLPVRADSVD